MVASVALKTWRLPLPLAALLGIVLCTGVGIVLEAWWYDLYGTVRRQPSS